MNGGFSAMYVALCCVGEVYMKYVSKAEQAYLWGKEFGPLLEEKLSFNAMMQLEIIFGQ